MSPGRLTVAFTILLLITPVFTRAQEISSSRLDADNALSAAMQVNGRTVIRVEYKNESKVPDRLKREFRKLEDKPLSVARLRNLLQWAHDTLVNSRIEILAEKRAAGVVLVLLLDDRNQISEIKITGATAFAESEIIARTGLRSGEDIEASRIQAAAQEVASMYQSAGYLLTEVDAKAMSDGSVIINIEENQPAIIREITIAEPVSVEDPRLRRILVDSALDAFQLEVGDRLSREEIKAGILRLQEWLLDRDFLVAEEPVVNSVILEGGKAAHLDIDIVYGPRIRFGFRNNERFSYKELLSTISEVEEVGVGADYLETVRSHIVDRYKEVGLVNVKVETEVREDSEKGYRHVSFIIDEGTRVRIESLKLEGIYAIPESEAIDLFLEYAPRLVQRYYFQEKGVRDAGNRVAEKLRTLGYLSAKLDLAKFRFNEERDGVEVELFFTEGVQTFVSSISMKGIRNIETEEVKSILRIKEGEPFNVFAFEAGLVRLKEAYRKRGYLNVEIISEEEGRVVQYSADQSNAFISLDVSEGPLIIVGDIVVKGNTQTHARVVTRELPFIKGDVLTSDLLAEAEENLRKLNLFASIVVRPIERPGAPQVRDILILVEEGVPGLIEFGPGLRNDLGLRFFIGASYQNLGGWHRGVNARAIVNRRLEDFQFLEYNFNVGFREPYFAGWRVTLFTNFTLLKRQFSSFSANITKGTAEFRRELFRSVTGFLQYSYERVTTFRAKDPDDEVRNLIGSFAPGVIIDTRDNIFVPTGGFFSVNRVEFASQLFGSQADVGYVRITSNNSTHFELGDNVIWSWAFNFGHERSNLEDKPIPKIKLFRLGGTGSIRGYKEESLEVESDNIINGTLSLVNYRSEVRFPLEGNFGMALFWDAGNLFIDHIRPFDLRHAAGVGLRYNTPVGPVSLDFARKLGRPGERGDGVNTDDIDKQRIHFSIGTF